MNGRLQGAGVHLLRRQWRVGSGGRSDGWPQAITNYRPIMGLLGWLTGCGSGVPENALAGPAGPRPPARWQQNNRSARHSRSADQSGRRGDRVRTAGSPTSFERPGERFSRPPGQHGTDVAG